MTFTSDQKEMLAAPLSREHVKERSAGKKTLSYVEGWHVIREANRIFGPDRWTRETFDMVCIADHPRKIGVTDNFAGYDGFGVSYICRVRIVVDGQVIREGTGSGHGIDRDRGLAHESAVKEAETDGMKRALMTFGDPFGLALYDKEQANVIDPQEIERQREQIEARERFIAGCKGTIEELGGNWQKLHDWWMSDAQQAARRKYDLSPAVVEELKALVLAKRPKQEGTNEQQR